MNMFNNDIVSVMFEWGGITYVIGGINLDIDEVCLCVKRYDGYEFRVCSESGSGDSGIYVEVYDDGGDGGSYEVLSYIDNIDVIR